MTAFGLDDFYQEQLGNKKNGSFFSSPGQWLLNWSAGLHGAHEGYDPDAYKYMLSQGGSESFFGNLVRAAGTANRESEINITINGASDPNETARAVGDIVKRTQDQRSKVVN